MKYTTFFFIAVLAVYVVSCKKQHDNQDKNFIPVNKCRDFNTDGKTITVCLDSVLQDSRCPADAMCIWQGTGVARFKVNTQNSIHIITLATPTSPTHSKDTAVAGFKIEFINLLPNREMIKPYNYKDYVAEVKVAKL